MWMEYLTFHKAYQGLHTQYVFFVKIRKMCFSPIHGKLSIRDDLYYDNLRNQRYYSNLFEELGEILIKQLCK